VTLPPPPDRRPEPRLPDPGRGPIVTRTPEYDDPSKWTREDTRQVATAYDVLVFVVLIVIGVWCTWHGGSSHVGLENRVVLTWVWVGLIPALVLSAAAWIP